jgi:thioredoxin reductase (NADPH)
MQRPVFMLVSGDARRLDALRHDLSRRYEADYQVCVASSAAAVGKIDYHLYAPWYPLEQGLYPAMTEFLAAWDKSREPSFAAFRIIGPASSPRAHRLRDDLARASVPYRSFDDSSKEGRRLLREHDLEGMPLPVVLALDGTVLVDPSHEDLLATLGLPSALGTRACDVAIIGAGPAGLAAAVYAASEGLGTVVLDPELPGGQASTSSLIRNYLGFPHGLSGDDLATRAVNQAWLFGASFTLGAADGLTADGAARVVHAAGGQAAIHLSKYAATVTMVVRGPGLAASMSSYLITEISKTANIRVRPCTDVTGGYGQCSLERLTLRDRASGGTEEVPAAALFVMIGAEPRTAWLPDSVGRDEEGFILTGRNLQRAGKLPDDWPFERPPLLLETSIPGVFAAGDVRHRSVKRVASAVGEGATAIQLVHEFLRADRPTG